MPKRIETIYPKETLDKVIEIYTSEIVSLQAVADRTGVAWSAVRRYLIRNGIEIRLDKKLFSPEQKQEMVEKYNKPTSLRNLAKEYDCDVKTIMNTFDSIGFKRRETAKNITNPYKTDPVFRERRRNELRGENSTKWKGGVTTITNKIRCLPEYYIWRSKVLERENYTCEMCGAKTTEHLKVEIHAHHIKYLDAIIEDYNITNAPEAISCQKLWDVNNGQCLCKKCHSKLHNPNEI